MLKNNNPEGRTYCEMEVGERENEGGCGPDVDLEMKFSVSISAGMYSTPMTV